MTRALQTGRLLANTRYSHKHKIKAVDNPDVNEYGYASLITTSSCDTGSCNLWIAFRRTAILERMILTDSTNISSGA